MIKFTIDGEAVGKGRPRFSTKPYPHTYTPKETERYEEQVRLAFKSQLRGQQPFTGAVGMDITVCVGLPRVSKKKQAMMLAGEIVPAKKPDADNIAKIIMDALSGLAYEDDKQVTTLVISKHYEMTPHVEVRMVSMDEMKGTGNGENQD